MSENIKLSITAPNEEAVIIDGSIQYLPNTKEDVSKVLSETSDPFSDFFLLTDETGKGCYVFRSSAQSYSLAGKKLEDLKAKLPTGEVVIQKIVDNSGKIKISGISIVMHKPVAESAKPEAKPDAAKPETAAQTEEVLLPHEKYLKEHLEAFLNEKMKDQKMDEQGFNEILQMVLPLLNATTLRFEHMLKRETDGTCSLKLEIVGAPHALDISGLPVSIQQEAKAFMKQKIDGAFQQHPYINGNCLIGNECRFDDSFVPLGHLSTQVLAWRYPSSAPTKETALDSLLRLISSAPPADLVPPILPGQMMPIPNDVIMEFQAWLAKRLQMEKGRYTIDLVPASKAGFWKLKVENKPYNIKISQEVVDRLKEQGVDFSEEAAILQKGVTQWTANDLNAFLDRVRKKYREKGFEYITNHPHIFKSHDGGKSFWMQIDFQTCLKQGIIQPMIRTETITVKSDDAGLEEFPSLESIKKAIFADQVAITQSEFLEGYQKAKDIVRAADYLVANVYPDQPQSGLPLVSEGGHTLHIPVARLGDLKIEAGAIPELSVEALREGMQWTKGDPFRPDAFYKKLMRVLNRLKLQPKGIKYIYEDLTHLNVILKEDRPQASANVGAGVDVLSGQVMGQASVVLPHMIPGFSETSVEVGVGAHSQTVGVGFETLPLTDGGLRLQTNLQFDHQTSSYIEGYEYIGGGVASTLLIPLGDEGVGSPLHLMVPVRLRYAHRVSDQEEIPLKDNLITGTGIGLSYAEALGGGFLEASVRQDIDRDMLNGETDTTTRVSATYQRPLDFLGLGVEANADFYYRHLLEGKSLSPNRVVETGLPPLHFSQGMEAIPHNLNATASVLIKRPFDFITPFVGVSFRNIRALSPFDTSLGEHHQSLAAGFGVDIPMIGLRLFAGWEFMEDGVFGVSDAKPKIGISVGKRWAW
ncbi:MAG: hypothetical protein HQM16_09290 [Deltaproteobacteria bacterium]|nr:hypothetical protein [Deltaproteobacteria bacterium]